MESKELDLINGEYETVSAKVNFLSKINPTLVFYWKLLRIIIDASLKAKKDQYDDEQWIRSSMNVIRLLESVGIKLHIEGIKNIEDLDGPCVFIANHMSTLETFVLPALIQPKKRVTFVVKDTLVKYPVFKHIMLSRNPIVVSRKNAREDFKRVIEGGTERLKEGISVIIFPQTTRRVVFNPREFNTIGIKLALRANVPVVPVALKTDAWGNGKYLKDFGKIDPSKKVFFAFGKPLYIKDRGTEEHLMIIEFITNKLRQWGCDLVDGS